MYTWVSFQPASSRSQQGPDDSTIFYQYHFGEFISSTELSAASLTVLSDSIKDVSIQGNNMIMINDHEWVDRNGESWSLDSESDACFLCQHTPDAHFTRKIYPTKEVHPLYDIAQFWGFVQQSEYWLTADRRKLPLEELDDEHLVNLVNWVRRKTDQIKTIYKQAKLNVILPRHDPIYRITDLPLFKAISDLAQKRGFDPII